MPAIDLPPRLNIESGLTRPVITYGRGMSGRTIGRGAHTANVRAPAERIRRIGRRCRPISTRGEDARDDDKSERRHGSRTNSTSFTHYTEHQSLQERGAPRVGRCTHPAEPHRAMARS